MTGSIRGRGVIKFFAGILVAVLIWLVIYFVRLNGFVPSSFFVMIPLAMPGVYALVGLLEVITGIPFLEIATRWDKLAGWQRGVLGMLVVVLALVVVGAGMVLFGQP